MSGVIRDGNRYRAVVRINGRNKWLGSYGSFEEANEAGTAAQERHLRKCLAADGRNLEDAVVYFGYYVFRDGVVYNWYGHKMSVCPDPQGYLKLKLAGRHVKLHRVVAECFVPNPWYKPHVCFRDGNKNNCHADNLYWHGYRM